MGIHIKLFNDAQWAVAKSALATAGSDLKADAISEVTKLEAAAQAAYPALTAAFKTAFDEVKDDTTVTGFAKMEKVVMDLLPQIPTIAPELANLTNLKDFLLKTGQTIFTDGLADLEAEAKKLVDMVL